MQIIIIIILIIWFFSVSPKFFKWLLGLDLIFFFVMFVIMRIAGCGKGRQGCDADLLEFAGVPYAISVFGILAIIICGIIAGTILRWRQL
jgi:hypothetical protein